MVSGGWPIYDLGMGEEISELSREVASLRAEVAALRTELTVQRINVVEPDGTVRLVLSGQARSPGGQVDGVTVHRDGQRPAGVIFFNDEGSECGGLIFGGGENSDGSRDHTVHLSFDRFRNDQALTLTCHDEGPRWTAGLRVQDRPASSLGPLIRQMKAAEDMPAGPARDRAIESVTDQAEPAPLRVFAGRDNEGTAMLVLHDGEQRPRIRLAVSLDGEASLDFLDADGEPISSYPDRPQATEAG